MLVISPVQRYELVVGPAGETLELPPTLPDRPRPSGWRRADGLVPSTESATERRARRAVFTDEKPSERFAT